MRRFSAILPVGSFLLVLTVAMNPSAQAQTFTVLHTFTGGKDGANPIAGLTLDNAGNLYGTAFYGGAGYDQFGYGTVYKLTHKGSGWTFNPLYSFAGGNDGESPLSRVTFGPDGSLYGTTGAGGEGGCQDYGAGCGTVFNLRPPATACKTALCPWTETVLYRFTGGSDGGTPYAEVVFDQAGNLYGTTQFGGVAGCYAGCGVVYELQPSAGGWVESVLYEFTDGSDGAVPFAGVAFDQAGNLYGTASDSDHGSGYGTVFQLAPSGPSWIENTLLDFQGGSDGGGPVGGLVFGQSDTLYGSTIYGGPGNGGTVFALTPSNGNWTYSLVYGLIGTGPGGPRGNLAMDAAGNLYGTTNSDGAYGYGSVFKLALSNGGWTETDLHDFTGGSDGAWPYGTVLLDANGNLHGTAAYGGDPFCNGGGRNGCGVVWEITP